MKTKTIIKGARGMTPEGAVEMAYDCALAEASRIRGVVGNPAETGELKSMAFTPRDENPMSAASGRHWYEAVVAVAFPIEEPPAEEEG